MPRKTPAVRVEVAADWTIQVLSGDPWGTLAHNFEHAIDKLRRDIDARLGPRPVLIKFSIEAVYPEKKTPGRK
jgi:hypothetical protein